MTNTQSLSKLKKRKSFFLLSEAAEILTKCFDEKVTTQDVIEFILHKHLTISVRIIDPLPAEKIEIRKERMEDLLEKRKKELAPYADYLNEDPEEGMRKIFQHVLSSCLDSFSSPMKIENMHREDEDELPKTGEFNVVYPIDAPTKITGLWDLPMLGSEIFEVERIYQKHLNDERDRVNVESYTNSGIFLASPENGDLYRLSYQQKAYMKNEEDGETEFLLTIPFIGFMPESVLFCIRNSCLIDFINNQETEIQNEDKNGRKTTNQQAKLIYALLKYSFGENIFKSLRANLDVQVRAKLSEREIELPATPQTIENWLKKCDLIS